MKKVLFLAAMMLAAMTGWSYNYDFSAVAPSGQTLYYKVQSGQASVVYPNRNGSDYYYNFNKPSGALTIPDSVSYNGLSFPVTAIGSCAFYNCNGLTAVTFPNTILTIGQSAFRGCSSLIAIDIPDVVTTIESGAFWQCTQLSSVIIGRGVTSIGSGAFYNCTGMTSVIFNSDSCTYISPSDYYGNYHSFYHCNNIQSFIFGEHVKVIPAYLCQGMTASTVLPDSLIIIGEFAFYGCTGLTGTLTIPASVTTIGENAFYGCQWLTSINLKARNCTTDYSPFHNCTNITSITFGDEVVTVPDYICSELPITGAVTIPSSVTTIGGNAFYNCTGITSVSLSSSLSNIDDNAFYGCTGLTSISLPSSLTRIGSHAFQSCSGLTSIVIPDSVVTIGAESFRYCTGLTSVTIGKAVDTISSLAFGNCTNITTFVYNATCCCLPSGNPFGGSGLNGTIVTIGDDVNTIPNYLFSYFTAMTLSLGSGLTSIGANAFQNSSVSTLSYNCNIDLSSVPKSEMTTLIIGDSVTTINTSAFAGCTNLTGTVTIPDNVTTIGSLAFQNCSTLTAVSIGASVASIGQLAFKSCTSLATVDMMPTVPPTLGALAFDDNAANRVFNIPGCTYDSYAQSWAGYPAYVSALHESSPCAPVQYTLTVNSANPTMGTVTGGGTYDSGATATLTATANEGYHFTQWNDNNTNNPRTVTVTDDATYTAYFEANTDTVAPIDTTVVTIHDTIYVTMYVHDTVIVLDTVLVDNNIHDTVYVDHYIHDTVSVALDTMIVTVHDTVNITVHDTLTVTVHDTLTVTVHDTVGILPRPSDSCLITAFPYMMDFNNGDAPCWTMLDVDGDNHTWDFINNHGVDNTQCAYARYASNTDDWLISPYLPGGGEYTLFWKAKVMSSTPSAGSP